MRLASNADLASVVDRLSDDEPPFIACNPDMLNHPVAGRSMRNYMVLEECYPLLAGLRLTDDELFWSIYYWTARFIREWQAATGDDAGLKESLFMLLETAERVGIALDPLPEVEAAVEAEAIIGPRPCATDAPKCEVDVTDMLHASSAANTPSS